MKYFKELKEQVYLKVNELQNFVITNMINTLQQNVKIVANVVANEVKTAVHLKVNELQNFVGDRINDLQESSLEVIIRELLQTNFKTEKQDKCIELIQKIIDLSIKTELHQEWSDLQYKAKKNQIQGDFLGNEGNTAVTKAKGWNEKYLKWELGDAEKIYNALKMATEKEPDGKITDRVIENIASDSLVKNFFKMISAYIQYAIGLANQNDLDTTNNKRNAGPFMKRIKTSEAAKDMRAKPSLI